MSYYIQINDQLNPIGIYTENVENSFPITEEEKDLISESGNMSYWQYKDGKIIESEYLPEILKNQYNNQQKINREKAYQLQSDPIFMKWQRGEATEQEWLDKIAEIKAAFPYQE